MAFKIKVDFLKSCCRLIKCFLDIKSFDISEEMIQGSLRELLYDQFVTFQMAQELGIVEKDENYVNPYKEDSKMVCSFTRENKPVFFSGSENN